MVEQKTPIKWKFETEGSVNSSPTIYEGVVYFGSTDWYLYALDVKIEENNAKISENMSSQIKIYSSHSRPRYFIVEECGGSLTLDEVVDLLQKTDDYEDYMLEEDIFYNNNIFHYYGATTIVNNLVSVPAYKKDEYNLNDLDDPCEHLPDNNLIEKTLDLDSYYTDQPGYGDGDKIENETEFFHYAYCFEKGYWNYEAFEIEKKFNPQALKPVFYEKSKQGVISHYLYNDKTSGESIEIYGELGSNGSRPSMNKCADLFANTSEGLRWINFEKIKSDMSNKGIDLDDKKTCRQYLIEKYNFNL